MDFPTQFQSIFGAQPGVVYENFWDGPSPVAFTRNVWAPVFQQVYNTAKYTPQVPNWAPFRQLAADTLNAVMADCGSDLKGSLDKLANQFTDELKRQNVYGG